MPDLIADSPSLGYDITEIFAFVAVDEAGEGIASFTHPSMGTMPLIGADAARVDSLRPIAQQIASATGRTIRLVRFDRRTLVEEIKP